jgi:hypothetical protein
MRDCMASLSSHLSPRTTRTKERQSAGMSAGRFPAPARDILPGCASWKIRDLPHYYAICIRCFHFFSKCGEESGSEWQTTLPAIERPVAW